MLLITELVVVASGGSAHSVVVSLANRLTPPSTDATRKRPFDDWLHRCSPPRGIHNLGTRVIIEDYVSNPCGVRPFPVARLLRG